MKPWVFIVFYILFSFGPTVLGIHDGTISVLISSVSVLFSVCLHTYWMVSSIYRLGSAGIDGDKSISPVDRYWNLSKRLIIASVVLFIVCLLFGMVLPPYFGESIIFDYVKNLSFFFSIASIIAICWVSAAALCDFERKNKINSHGIFVTFIMYFYIIVGVVFLDRRIKKALNAL